MNTSPTIRYEYKDEQGQPSVLIFENPDLTKRQRISIRFGIAQSKWECTELAKRLEGYRKERLDAWLELPEEERANTPEPNGVVPSEIRAQLQADIPDEQLEDEIFKERAQHLLVVLETMRLIRGLEVNGQPDPRTSEELREEFSRLHPDLLMDVMGPAFLQIFPKLKKEDEPNAEEESR